MVAPRLEILPSAQRQIWQELASIPRGFILYGGTGIALRLGHRQSVDFDFFSFEDFDPDLLIGKIPLLQTASVVQKEPNTLTVLIEREAPVQISFFGLHSLGQALQPEAASDTGINIASLLDLAGSKMAVIQKRAEARDYLDIDAIITSGGIDVASALAAARVIYGRQFNPQISLKALSYFEDGTLPQLSRAVRSHLTSAVMAVDLDHLPQLVPYRPRPEDA